MLIDMARIHMTTLVAFRAAAWETSGIRRWNGGDGMNWSPNAPQARGPARSPCQPVEQRLPGGTGHHQRGRREHEQQVLEHVHEEVVVRPVVDGRFDCEEQDRETGVEPQ